MDVLLLLFLNGFDVDCVLMVLRLVVFVAAVV